jgi:diaminohydroxyphosphoribosylaminopyrimidine deaminase/5-amino-6-(5-phosphoribosylamino)uracil reductase
VTEDERFMSRALDLAARGLGTANPNPLVGCVVVRSGRTVGEGYHSRAGGPHAEVLALKRAGSAARGGTLYVNLEPCSHFGRTPPCAPQVVASGIRRVVLATSDPNPEVSGRGIRILRRHGVQVESGLLAERARLLNRGFLEGAPLKRPFILLKAALTLDGRIASATGDSRFITSALQRRMARRLRGCFDALAVGIGTVLADDPLLLPSPRPARPFRRVVFDSSLRLPLGSRLVETAGRSTVTVVCGAGLSKRKRRLAARGIEILETSTRNGRLVLPRALASLKKMGVSTLMVEGGSELLGSFLDGRLLDEVALFRAPLLMGGAKSLPAFGGRGARKAADALRLRPLPIGLRFPGFPEGLFELFRP